MKAQIRRFNPAADYYFAEGCFINELSNTADDAAVSVAQARVMPGDVTRWHALDGITERYVILAGSGEVDVGDLAAQPVGTGDVVIIPPGVAQRIRNTGQQELVFLAICSPRFVADAYSDLEA